MSFNSKAMGLEEMRELMAEKEDYTSMPLPRSFAKAANRFLKAEQEISRNLTFEKAGLITELAKDRIMKRPTHEINSIKQWTACEMFKPIDKYISELEAELKNSVPFEVLRENCKNDKCEYFLEFCHKKARQTCPLVREK